MDSKTKTLDVCVPLVCDSFSISLLSSFTVGRILDGGLGKKPREVCKCDKAKKGEQMATGAL